VRHALRLVASIAAALALACAPRPQVAAAPVGPTLSLPDGGERRDLRFPCGDDVCAAWLFLPAGAARPPVVVMAHGFAGTRDVSLPLWAERFAREGVASLLFDYRHFGASGGWPRQLVDPWRQDEDWKAALAFARTLDAVDPRRIAVFGSSLGAGHALIAAAENEDVRAVVAQVPMIDTQVESQIPFAGFGWAARLLLTGWADLASERLLGRAIEIPAMAPTSGFGVVLDDYAYASIEATDTAGTTYRNAVAAHSPFTFDDWNPAGRLADLRVPVLAVASRSDRFVPFAAVEGLAAASPQVIVVEIPGDHFDVYAPPLREQAAEIEARFLREQLLR
jgi:pimeloyl-ACP methyl ester carboxylesterase